ncbi:MAG TPA: hypothetical protein VF139_05520 [Candidatus Polarisedimenticolaceae bacterium]
MKLLALALLLTSGAALAAPGDPPNRHQVRLELTHLLLQYPPELGQVLKLDPALMQNAAYLAPYPELSTYLQAHPEVFRQPQFYLEDVSMPFEGHRAGAGERMTMDVLGGLSALFVLIVVVGVLAWLIKTLVAQRRWAQLVRVQTEAHNKLLDRFAGSEELLAYIQSPAGRRFLEATPIPVADGPAPAASPFGRILGAVQIGIVLTAGGVGLRLVASKLAGNAAIPIAAVGTFVIAIGVGFVLSSAVSWFLSRRLGVAGAPDARA